MLTLLGAQLYRYVRRSAAPGAGGRALGDPGARLERGVVPPSSALTSEGRIAEDGPASVAWAHLAVIPYLVGPAVGLIRPAALERGCRVSLVPGGPRLPRSRWRSSTGSRLSSRGSLGRDCCRGRAGGVRQPSPPPPTRSCVRSWRLATILVYRGRGDADTAAARLAERLDDLPEPLAVSQTVAQAVADAVRADTVELRGDGLFSATRRALACDGCRGIVQRSSPSRSTARCSQRSWCNPRPGERSSHALRPRTRGAPRAPLGARPPRRSGAGRSRCDARSTACWPARRNAVGCDAISTMTSRRRCPAWD